MNDSPRTTAHRVGIECKQRAKKVEGKCQQRNASNVLNEKDGKSAMGLL
jgi:hypothetical protein